MFYVVTAYNIVLNSSTHLWNTLSNTFSHDKLSKILIAKTELRGVLFYIHTSIVCIFCKDDRRVAKKYKLLRTCNQHSITKEGGYSPKAVKPLCPYCGVHDPRRVVSRDPTSFLQPLLLCNTEMYRYLCYKKHYYLYVGPTLYIQIFMICSRFFISK